MLNKIFGREVPDNFRIQIGGDDTIRTVQCLNNGIGTSFNRTANPEWEKFVVNLYNDQCEKNQKQIEDDKKKMVKKSKDEAQKARATINAEKDSPKSLPKDPPKD